jgi:glutathione S-transferase
MKLYYAPGACSLADHIALHEAGIAFECEKVDLKSKRTQSGADSTTINPKGYVPALTLDSGETLTENVAILDWIAHQYTALKPSRTLGHTHLLQALAYISTEIQKGFKPFFSGAGEEDKSAAGKLIVSRMDYVAGTMKGAFLFGTEVSVADCYLFVMLLWSKKNDLKVSAQLDAFRARMIERVAVKTAMKHEGLS